MYYIIIIKGLLKQFLSTHFRQSAHNWKSRNRDIWLRKLGHPDCSCSRGRDGGGEAFSSLQHPSETAACDTQQTRVLHSSRNWELGDIRTNPVVSCIFRKVQQWSPCSCFRAIFRKVLKGENMKCGRYTRKIRSIHRHYFDASQSSLVESSCFRNNFF